MTPSTFPLTIGCLFSQEVWIVYCPEWGYECRAISKETAKKRLYRKLCDTARDILSEDNVSEEKKEVARIVLENKEMLPELLREVA